MTALPAIRPGLRVSVDVVSDSQETLWVMSPTPKVVLYQNMINSLPLLGFGADEFPGWSCFRKPGDKTTWTFLLTITPDLFDVIDRSRVGGDVNLGFALATLGFVEHSGSPLAPSDISVQDQNNPSMGIVPYRIPESDWKKMRGQLGHKTAPPARVFGGLVGALLRVRGIFGLVAFVRHLLGLCLGLVG